MSEAAMKTKEKSKDSDVRSEKRSARRENRTGIPTQLKERMEENTGLSFDDVRVHYNSALPARLDALAYTKGNQVEIGPGQERHLPHELGHVVQQKLGMVRANGMHSSGVALNTEARLERQADEIGAGKRIPIVQRMGCNVVQRFFPDNAMVVRGGPCKLRDFKGGQGVTDMNGQKPPAAPDGYRVKLKGISVNCDENMLANETDLVKKLPENLTQYAVTTAGAIQAPAIDGKLRKDPVEGNEYHCELYDITANEANSLFQPVKARKKPEEPKPEEIIPEEL